MAVWSQRSTRTAGGALLCLAVLASSCRGGPDVSTRAAGSLGQVRVYRPSGQPAALVFLFSDRDGWQPALGDVAASLAERGAAVVGVDLPQYLGALATRDGECFYLVAELEALSHALERELGVDVYRSPILAGTGVGGTLAYAALAQAPAATIDGAAGPSPLPPLPTRVPLCAGAPFTPAPPDGFSYEQSPTLPGWWEAVPAGPGYLATLHEAIEDHLSPPAVGLPADLSDLPLTEVPATQPGDTMAVVYSGDGGWRDLDEQIAGVLASEGVPVVGVDSLRYFWHRREPDVLAHDLARILGHYETSWSATHVLLVGYSFGADVLPFIVNRLPPEARRRVEQISLLAVGRAADFEFHVAGWLGAAPSNGTLPILPEATKLDLQEVQCVYGAEEEDTLCTAPELAGAEIIRTAGGHHFDGDYRALAAHILDGARRRRRQ